jgi:hypothetical protein
LATGRENSNICNCRAAAVDVEKAVDLVVKEAQLEEIDVIAEQYFPN